MAKNRKLTQEQELRDLVFFISNQIFVFKERLSEIIITIIIICTIIIIVIIIIIIIISSIIIVIL